MENQFEDSSEGSLQLEDFAAIEDLVHRKAGRPRSENKKSKDELKKQRQETREKGRERIARERPPVPLKFASYRAFNWESGMKPKKKNDDDDDDDDDDGDYTTEPTRARCELLNSAYHEQLSFQASPLYSGKKNMAGITPVRDANRLSQICNVPGCGYASVFSYNKPTDRWDLLHWKPHDEARHQDATPGPHRVRRCHYSAKQLAPIAVEALTTNTFKVEAKQITTLLKPYTRDQPSSQLVNDVSVAAYAQLFGTLDENLRRLPRYLQDLELEGYGTSHRILNTTQMNQVVRKYAESAWKYKMKSTHPAHREAFDWAKVEMRAESGERYLGRWSVHGFPYILEMLKTGKILGLRISDFAFMKGKAGGNVGNRTQTKARVGHRVNLKSQSWQSE